MSAHLKKEPISLGDYLVRYGATGIYDVLVKKKSPEVNYTFLGPQDSAIAADILHWRGLKLMLALDKKRHFLRRTDPVLDYRSIFPKRTGEEQCCKRSRSDDAESDGKEEDCKKARPSEDASWNPEETLQGEIGDDFDLVSFGNAAAVNVLEDDGAKEVYRDDMRSVYDQQVQVFDRCEQNGHLVPSELRNAVLLFLSAA